MLWNPQSLNSTTKIQMLTHSLHTEQIDIVHTEQIDNETFLKPIHTFQIYGYTIYRNDRRTHAHGGVAIAIKNNSYSPQMSHFTQQIVAMKNTIQRKWHRSNCPNEKRNLKRMANKYKKKINELVSADQNQHWNAKLRNITKGNKSLWKLTKTFKEKSDTTVGKTKINGSTSIDDNDRANCLAKTFQKSHSLTATYTHENDDTVRHTVQAFNLFGFASCQTPTINTNQVHNVIKSLRPFKAPGPDDVQNILLKNLPHSAINYLTTVFNKCIQ